MQPTVAKLGLFVGPSGLLRLCLQEAAGRVPV